MTPAEFENGVNNILDNTPKRGVSGSQGLTKYIFKLIVAQFKAMFADVKTAYEAGMNWRGAWSGAIAYAVRDVVSSNGSTYRCKVAHTNQAVTNTAYWDLVAGKGESGNQIMNFGGSLLQNGALENGTTDGWPDCTIDGYLNGLPILKASSAFLSDYKIKNRKDRILRLSAVAKVTSGYYIIYLFRKDKDGNNIQLGGDGFVYSQSSSKNNTSYQKIEFLFYSNANNIYSFGDSDHLKIYVYASDIIYFNSLIVESVPLSEPVASDLTYLPYGQSVYDINNPSKIGVYVNSTIGIVWLNKEVIPLQPNGTSISMVINRPYKWTWALMYNDGVTTVTLPSATINANTNATFVLTGTAGKIYTIVIYPSV